MGLSGRNKAVTGALAAAGLATAGLLAGGARVVKGRSRARDIATTGALPQEADVVIVGGGNMGAAAALFLADAGLSVVLCEKGAIAGEASGRSVGHVVSLGHPVEEAELLKLANNLWPQMNGMTGCETGYRRPGVMMRIDSEEERAFWQAWLEECRDLAPAARLLDSAQAGAMAALDRPWHGAIFNPHDASAEPRLFAPALAEGARARGARLVAPCAVRGIETSGGAVSSVVTELGTIRTRIVVLAGGAWSTMFMESLGLRLPMANLFSWCASLDGVEGPEVNGMFENATWRRELDGGYTTSILEGTAPITPRTLRYLREMLPAMRQARGWKVKPRMGRLFFEELTTPRRWKLDQTSPFERRRILEPRVDRTVVSHAIEKLRRELPAFKNARLRESWGGVIFTTPDREPVLGSVDSIPGLVMATGAAAGLALAAAIGKVVADLVTGRQPSVDISRFSLNRFRQD